MSLILTWSFQASHAHANADDAPHVVRIYFDSTEQLAQLTANVDVWEVQHQRGYVVALVTATQSARLTSLGYRLEIDEERSARVYQLQPTLRAAQSGVPNYPCYRTIVETYTDLAALAAQHPDLARWIDVGDSWDKVTMGEPEGHDIYTLVLTNRAQPGPKPRFFLMGAIHAREMTTAELTTRLAEYLVEQYGHDPDVTWLLDYHELHIMPIANPDGRAWAEQLYLWRKNTNSSDSCIDATTGNPLFPYYGVDLNRNSSFKWNECQGSGCSSSNACNLTFRGSAPASEPETQVIQNYVTSLFADRRGPQDDDAAPDDTSGLLISLHSYSELVLFPWGWTTDLAPNVTQLQTLGRKFGYFTGYRTCQSGAPGCIYQTDGSTDDWSYGELGVASYTFELGTDFFQACSYFESRIVPDLFPALLYGFKATRQPYQTPAGPEALQVAITPTQIVSGTLVTLTATLDDTRFDSNGAGVEASQVVSAARYTIDAPSWITGTALYTMTAADGDFDASSEAVVATIETTGWAVGRHTLFVEGQDADGNWGVPSARFLTVAPSVRAVEIDAPSTIGETHAGRVYSYTLTVHNTGTVSDVYAVEVISSTWPVSVPLQLGPITPGTSTSVTVRVQPPLTATIGTTDTLTVRVTSQAADGPSITAQLTTRTIPWQQILPLIRHDAEANRNE